MFKTIAVTGVLASMSCSIALQRSVRGSSVECSDSYGWAIADLVAAGGFVFAATTGINDTPQPLYVLASEIAAAAMVASAAIGFYKRHNCAHWRATAPPEVWAAVAERHRREAEAAARDNAAAAAQAEADAKAQAAAQAACPVGTIASNNMCLCPGQMTWDGATCVTPMPVGHGPTPAPAPSPSQPSQQRPIENRNTPAPVVHHETPPPPPVAPKNPPWHAMYQSASSPMTKCQVFDAGQDSVGVCSRYCTGMLLQKLKCQCDVGRCP